MVGEDSFVFACKYTKKNNRNVVDADKFQGIRGDIAWCHNAYDAQFGKQSWQPFMPVVKIL